MPSQVARRNEPDSWKSWLLAAPMLLAGAACAQLPVPVPPRVPASAAPVQSLPAAQPTQSQPVRSTPPAAATPQSFRARVEFANDLLSIVAQNSSLNEILNDISRLTGLKITGGVADERVYGNYGPASAQAVINQLLDGTGTNMLLIQNPQHNVSELILTPRNGGPTPPNPNARTFGDEENVPPGLGARRRDLINGRRSTLPNGEVRSFEPPLPYSMPQPPVPPSATPEGAVQPNTIQPDSSQQSPNGVRTPREMIFDNLSNQQQQQQQPPAGTPPQ